MLNLEIDQTKILQARKVFLFSNCLVQFNLNDFLTYWLSHEYLDMKCNKKKKRKTTITNISIENIIKCKQKEIAKDDFLHRILDSNCIHNKCNTKKCVYILVLIIHKFLSIIMMSNHYYFTTSNYNL